MKQWQERGIDLTVAINVSSWNLERPGFIEALQEAAVRHGIAADRIHIECTEHTVMTGQATQDTLKALRHWGAQVSLDDFGMGFSNLSCLTSLPVQLLKLDQRLAMPIATEARALQLVTSLIQMGHRLGYRMLAEGVESEEVLRLLVQAGCDAAQGFHLSRPLEATALLTFIEQQAPPQRVWNSDCAGRLQVNASGETVR